MKHNFNIYLLTAIAAMYAWPVLADDTTKAASPTTLMEAISMGKPMTNFRLRYENVDQEGKAEHSNAWTMRSLIGWQTKPLNNFSVAAQLINVTQFNHDFYDNTNTTFGGATPANKAAYPLVVDPDYTGVNQLFVEWTGLPATKVRLGRQSVKLDNVRFVGNVEFRQIMQVFDGIAFENKSVPNVELYAAHFEGLRRITSEYFSKGSVEIAHATWKYSPTENLTGYGYLQDMAKNGFTTGLPSPSDNSTQTFGLRADGAHKINDNWKALYTAEYAKQDNYRGGNSAIDTHYWRLGGGAGFGNWSARLDREVLSSNNGLYGFQTPLATGHLFQGLGDSFLTTPKQGIEDTFITLNGKVLDVQLSAEYHWLDSNKNFATTVGTGKHYGKELDLVAGYSYDKNWSSKIEYFSFKEDEIYSASRKRDKDNLLVTLLYTF